MAVPKVTYVLVNNLGGITTMLQNLVVYRNSDALPQEAFIISVKGSSAAPITEAFAGGIPQQQFLYTHKHNLYHMLGKMAAAIGNEPGVLVSNDLFELLMLKAFNLNKKVVQIVHDAYNVRLALDHGEVVDRFICHSKFYYDALCMLLGRKEDIIYLPYGIPLTGTRRTAPGYNDPLRLLFLGRHDKAKGVYDLHAIEQLLLQKAVPASWTILGRGPETGELQEQWKDSKRVRFYSPQENREVLELLRAHDVLVFPSRFEGFPVALLESMAAGLVPVASDLPGGLRELVKNDVNGYLCNTGDVAAFAQRIEQLHTNRSLLEQLSNHAFEEVNQQYNAAIQSPKYQQVFSELAASATKPRHHSVRAKIGSKLDQRWLPNWLTRALRKQF